MSYFIAFVIGIVFTFLLIVQQTNTFHGRVRASFVTSLAISVVGFIQINYAVREPVLYLSFAIGAAFGSSFGNAFGNRFLRRGRSSEKG